MIYISICDLTINYTLKIQNLKKIKHANFLNLFAEKFMKIELKTNQ